MDFDAVVSLAEQTLANDRSSTVRPVINLSGVILHTGLGRSLLNESAARSVAKAAAGHVTVEYDLNTGQRGDRQEHVRSLLTEMTGAQDALVVNNCAGAVFLTLAALCQGKEVVLSRGQMVEIGGSFRMPEIVQESGCKLVEVGCTNKTRPSDYANVMSENTAAVLRCHPSNFKVIGFTDEVSARQLAKLAHDHDVHFIDDVGHGCLIDTTQFGLPKQNTLRDAIADGADIVLSSGDKLLGGPQAGMILGKKHLVSMVSRHPLSRALRIDKLCLAGLEATLRAYRDDEWRTLPLWKSVGKDLAQIKREASAIARSFSGPSKVERSLTEVGGGSLPGTGVPTFCSRLSTDSPDDLAARLRRLSIPVIGRVERGSLWLDPRTATAHEVKIVCRLVKEELK